MTASLPVGAEYHMSFSCYFCSQQQTPDLAWGESIQEALTDPACTPLTFDHTRFILGLLLTGIHRVQEPHWEAFPADQGCCMHSQSS